MKEKTYKLLVFFLVSVSLALRLYKLGEIPPSLHWDEASWGYNAYSILKTGKDEYGKFLPIILKAFGDYKPPVYAYLVAVTMKIFGVNEFAVRFPSAILGSLSVYILFLLVREIFPDFEDKNKIALYSSILLAFSPWHFHYSRGAWEINVLSFFVLLGLILFLKNQYLFSSFVFAFCFYIYNAAKLIVPLLLFGLLFFNKEKILKIPNKTKIIGLLVFIIMILPVVKFTFWGGAGGRLKVMSIFSYPRNDQEAIRLASQSNSTPKSLIYKIYHGKPMFFTREILLRYLNHFSGKFLFFEGDWTDTRHSVPFTGQLNFLNILLLPLGVFYLISQKIKKQGFLWFFLAISPLPAALTRNVIQPTRSFFLIFPLSIIGGWGFYYILEEIKKTKKFLEILTGSFLILIFLTGFIYYLDNFFIHAPIANSSEWLYGYKEAVNFISDKTSKYSKVVFTQKYGQPYIYYLFYSKYPPEKYQKQAKLIEHPEGDVGRVEKIDNIEFREIYWPKDRFQPNNLYIGTPLELPLADIDSNQARILKEIKYLNGVTAFFIVETK